MSKKYSYFKISNKKTRTLQEFCQPNTFRLANQEDMMKIDILPPDLVKKCDNILIVASGSNDTALSYYMLNCGRIDEKYNAIDQEPLGLICSGSDAYTSGCLIHHGNWINRTTYLTDEFWECISVSGIGNCYPLAEIPQKKSGSISELKIDSQNQAFDELIVKLKQDVTT